MREEVEKTVHSQKAEKTLEVDSIPSERLKNESETTTTALTAIYQKRQGKAEEVDTIARHTFTKESQSQVKSELSYRQLNWPYQ